MKKTTKRSKTNSRTHCIVRTQSAGVFAGDVDLATLKQPVVEVRNARRIYYWAGAATLSELAVSGVARPSECKFPTPVDKVLLLGVIEVIPTTEAARQSIASVTVWSGR